MPRVVRRGRKRVNRRGRKLNKRELGQVKRQIGIRQERKYLNVTRPGYSSTAAGELFQVTSIVQGSTDNERNGDRIMLSKIYLRMNVIGADYYNYIRFIVFQWKPDSTTVPIISDILLVGAGGVTYDHDSQYNHDKRSQYKIMMDKVFVSVGDGTTGYPPQHNYAHYMKKTLIPPARQLQYIAASAVSGYNQIYTLSLSDSPFISASHPQIAYTMKILYTDS